MEEKCLDEKIPILEVGQKEIFEAIYKLTKELPSHKEQIIEAGEKIAKIYREIVDEILGD